jgi:RimJ/RimL family protein N-acetyltransferase
MPELTPPDPPLSRGRVLIRPPGNGDVDAITAACQDPDIVRFTRIPTPYTRERGQKFVEECREGWKQGRSANFVGIDLHNGMLLGSIGLVIDEGAAAAEIGYWVVPDARGSGVATTMGWLVATYGFEAVGLKRITLEAAITNEASNRLAERLGFTREGVMRSAWFDGEAGDTKAPRVDAHLWSLLPGELHEPDAEDREEE